ncbi:MAG: four-helix bundle copper-binding protein [Bacteroidota bacterium]
MENQQSCIEACLACMIECEKSASNCMHMDGHHECVKVCRDCADICNLCARLCARASQFSDAIRAICVKACEACINECSKHIHHADCVEACKKCIEACKM